jgi:hypothetical protein
MRRHTLPAVVFLALFLAACGADGSPASAPAPEPTPPLVTPDPVVPPAPTQASGPYTWSSALFGAGGYITGIVYHPAVPGPVYIRTDVGGAFRRDPGSSTWIPLNDDLSRDDHQLAGPASLAVDPNNAQKLYIAAGSYTQDWGRKAAILRSSDRGATWSRTALPIRLNGNSDGRGTGERLQVDPNMGNILFLGTNQDGLYKSTDTGVNWSQVPGFPARANTDFVLFDKSTGTPGSATTTVNVGLAATTGTALWVPCVEA